MTHWLWRVDVLAWTMEYWKTDILLFGILKHESIGVILYGENALYWCGRFFLPTHVRRFCKCSILGMYRLYYFMSWIGAILILNLSSWWIFIFSSWIKLIVIQFMSFDLLVIFVDFVTLHAMLYLLKRK